MKTARDLVIDFKFRNVARMEAQFDELMSSISPVVRRQGLSGILALKSQNSKAEALLNDPDTSVRVLAVKYVREAGNPNDYKLLVPLLNDPDDKVVVEALEAIYWLTSEYNIKKFLESSSPKIRLATFNLLKEELNGEDLDKYLEDSYLELQSAAWSTKLERTNDSEFLKRVLEEREERELIRVALIKLIAFDLNYCVEYLSTYLKDGTDRTDKEKAYMVAVLKDMPQENAAVIVNSIVEGSDNIPLLIKLIPAYVSYNEEAPARVISILNKFVTHDSPKIRVQAIRGFAKLEETSTVTTIREALNDSEDTVRAAAITAMAKFLDYQIVERIEEFMKDRSKAVRKATLRAIAKLKLEDFYYYLSDTVADTQEDVSVLKEAIKATGSLKLEDAIPFLIAIMKNDYMDIKVRDMAADALLKVSPEDVVSTLNQQVA